MGGVMPHTCNPGKPCGLCGRWGGAATAAKAPLPVVPCGLIGDELTVEERAARGLPHLRRWVWCEHPDKPLGEAVCGCRGCGPGCRGYAAAGASPV